MKRFIIRSILTIVLPFILIGEFIYDVLRETGRGVRYAWLSARGTIEEYRRQMRREDY